MLFILFTALSSSRSLTKKLFLINILCTILLFIICFLFFIITIFYYFLLLFLVRVEVQHLATEQYKDSILLKVYHLLPISHQMKKKLLLCSSAMRIPLKISSLYMNLDINLSLKSFFYLGQNGDLFTSSFILTNHIILYFGGNW